MSDRKQFDSKENGILAAISDETEPLAASRRTAKRRDVPNDETARVIRDARADRNLVRCENVDEMIRKLGI